MTQDACAKSPPAEPGPAVAVGRALRRDHLSPGRRPRTTNCCADASSNSRSNNCSERAAPGQRAADAPPADAEPLPVEVTCFPIDTVALDGAEPFAFLHDQATVIEGNCLGVQGLQVLQRRLQRALIERGFVTSRALVPEQNLGAGVLRAQVVPGRVEGVVEEGDAKDWLPMALPRRADGLLDQRDLDAAIENLRRLPSEHGTEIAVQPSLETGGSELLVRHAGDKAWLGIVSIDNTGVKSTGDIGAALTLVVDSPLLGPHLAGRETGAAREPQLHRRHRGDGAGARCHARGMVRSAPSAACRRRL